MHLYAYCSNNPINYVDPSGHFTIAIGCTLSAAFIAKCLYGLGAILVAGVAYVLGTNIKNKRYSYYKTKVENNRVYFGDAITRSKAVLRLRKGQDVWSKTAKYARSIAKSASPISKASKSEIHLNNRVRYGYRHYHPLNWTDKKRKKIDRIGSHSFYGEEISYY